jgi:hypothetical protein
MATSRSTSSRSLGITTFRGPWLRKRVPQSLGFLGQLALIMSCGEESPKHTISPATPGDSTWSTNSGNTESASGGASEATGATATIATTEEALISAPPTNSTLSPNANACQRDTYEAQRTELNLLLLIDLSGSMLTQVNFDTGDTQWDAVRQAVREFVTSPSADGLGLSVTYYPVLSERSACEPGSFCDNGTRCVSKVCLIPTLLGYPFECLTDNDCYGEVTFEDGTTVVDSCEDPYSCVDYELQLCFVDENCPNGDLCADGAGTVGMCPGTMSCNVDDYAVAKVPLQVLPTGRDALLASLDDSYVDFYSSTPTQVALEGAFRQVREWRMNEPEKRSVVVLATDGLPAGCETLPDEDLLQSTLQVLEEAAGEELSTFVIGVTPMEDDTIEGLAEQLAVQRASLNAMAQAGQTSAPFLVQADTSTTQAFLEALDAVRNVALACDYNLPEGTANFGLVNVELSSGGDPETIPKVDAPTNCAGGGWYYDSDETLEDDSPSRVVLCQSTCDHVQQVTTSRVDVVLGCPTIRQVL